MSLADTIAEALTNGREGRLYDNQIQGVAADKLVADATLVADSAFEAFLTALGKASVSNGGLESFAGGARLTSVLHAQMQDETARSSGRSGTSCGVSRDWAAFRARWWLRIFGVRLRRPFRNQSSQQTILISLRKRQ